jgi:uncharacterized membrane protein
MISSVPLFLMLKMSPSHMRPTTMWIVVRAVVWFAVTFLGLELLAHYVSHPAAWIVGLILSVVVGFALLQTRKKIGR